MGLTINISYLIGYKKRDLIHGNNTNYVKNITYSTSFHVLWNVFRETNYRQQCRVCCQLIANKRRAHHCNPPDQKHKHDYTPSAALISSLRSESALSFVSILNNPANQVTPFLSMFSTKSASPTSLRKSMNSPLFIGFE